MSFKPTFNRKTVATLAVAAMLLVAGCTAASQSQQGEELANSTGEEIADTTGESYRFETKKTEANQKDLVNAQPPEGMDTSLERKNLKKRNQYLNDQNNQHYVYLMSHGKVVTWFNAQGKVSSVNSKLTNDKQIVRVEGCEFGGNGYSEGSCYKTVESPQMDGSYGENGDAVFFFTTDGKYVQWNGEYIVSEQPLNIQTPVELTKDVDEGGNESSD